MSKKFWLWV